MKVTFRTDKLAKTCSDDRLLNKSPRIKAIKSKAEMISFAKQLGIAPGLVAGRYRHLTGKWTHFGGIIRKLTWV